MNLTPEPNYPTYPNYHEGLYLEDYFINFYESSLKSTDRKFIKIGWTSYYNNGLDKQKIQDYLDALDQNNKYFTVSQHDDAPSENLPKDTLVFCAGGNYKGRNKIPIPLICSKIPKKHIKTCNKDIFCSFVGSMTHPVRNRILQLYYDNTDFVLSLQKWTHAVSSISFMNFIDITSRSKYTLCPRGYGTSSFRLYECMQLNSIPVYISDIHDLPWSDELNWEDFCVLIKDTEVEYIKDILMNISEDQYIMMSKNIKKIYDQYFTLRGVCNNIIQRINVSI